MTEEALKNDISAYILFFIPTQLDETLYSIITSNTC
jgi:hypothetical protein